MAPDSEGEAAVPVPAVASAAEPGEDDTAPAGEASSEARATDPGEDTSLAPGSVEGIMESSVAWSVTQNTSP